MHIRRWLAVASALLLIGFAFLPWIHIDVLAKTITGINDQGLEYGPRGRGHIYFAVLCLILIFIGRNWAMLFAIVIAVINVAFAASHFYVYRCSAGVCPQKLAGLYLSVAASLALTLFLMYSPVRPDKNDD